MLGESFDGWTDWDDPSGTTTIEVFDGVTCWHFLTPNNGGEARQYINTVASTLERTYITYRFWPVTLGTAQTTDYFGLSYSGTYAATNWNLDIHMQQDEVRIRTIGGGYVSMKDAGQPDLWPTMDAWNLWTYEVVGGASPTVSIWVDGTLVINDWPIHVGGTPGYLHMRYDSWFVANLEGYVDYLMIGDGLPAEQFPGSPSASESPSESPSISPSNAPGPNSRSMITIYTFP